MERSLTDNSQVLALEFSRERGSTASGGTGEFVELKTGDEHTGQYSGMHPLMLFICSIPTPEIQKHFSASLVYLVPQALRMSIIQDEE